MRNKFIFTIITILSVYGCGNGINSHDMDVIDSLVCREKYDSAYNEVMRIRPQKIRNPQDRAHYNLLLTQTSYLTGNLFPPDSIIDFSIDCYERNGDKEKLCESYYYKAMYLISKEKYSQAILFCKKAENLATSSYQQMKIALSIAYINEICGNYDLQLQYAKKGLGYALETKKNDWIASSYCRMSEAYQYQEETDSAIVYADKTARYLTGVSQDELPYLLNSIGYAYLDRDKQKAKAYFEKSLSYKPLARTLENLAYVYKKEGNEEKAYELWKQALLMEDHVPQDGILYNILQYNLTHHDIDGAYEQLHDIVSIKDSLNDVLKDRSIQRIQQEYDVRATQDRHAQEILRWLVAALLLAVVVLLLLGYIKYKQYKAKILLTEHQMLINNYQHEIDRLKGHREGAERQITELNRKIHDLMEQGSPRLYKGKLLYDQIGEGGTTITWTVDDYNCFIDFYKASHFTSYERIIKKYSPKTAHNIFFLILYEMGMKDQDVRRIMSITQEAIRSTRYRINKHVND